MGNFRKSCKTLYCFCLLAYALFHIPAVQAQSDVTPPELVAFNFTPSAIVDSPNPQPVTFTLQITDDLSGFQSASWRLVSSSGKQFYDISITATSRISGNGLDGIYATVFDLPPHREIGTWHVAHMRVTDVAGNIRVYDDMPVYNSPALFTADSGVSRVFAGDFNLDSITDIAVVSAPTVTVYLGSGNGTFGPGITSTIASGLQGGWIGDFNGDGIPDIAFNEVSDVIGGTTPVGVLFGNANGTFQPYRIVGSLPYETGPVVGDFDGDGRSDFAGVGSWGGFWDAQHSGIVILWGRGDGNFDRSELITDIGLSRTGHNLFTADLNGDGIPDLVWGKYYSNTTGTLLVMLGQGNRTFGSPNENTSVGRPAAYASADFNGDGNMDLAVQYGGNPWGGVSGNTGILYGNGDGTFQPVTFVMALNLQGVTQLSVSDLDRDGRPDLTVITGDGFVLLTNNGNGTFRQYVLTNGTANHPDNNQLIGYGIADFNGDGLTDFVVGFLDDMVGVYLGIPATAVTLTQSNPTSTFGQAVTLTATVTPAGLLGPVTFYDGANVIGSALLEGDQAVFTTKTLQFGAHALRAAYRGTLMGSTASFSSAASHTVTAGAPSSNLLALAEIEAGFTPARLAAGDFNKDGHMDLVATDYSYENTLHVFLGNGNGTFPPSTTYGTGINRFIVRPVAVGDWNQDGNLDIEAATETATHEYKGNGDGTFELKRGVLGWPLLGDVNRDGTLDRVYVDGANISVLLGKGDKDGSIMTSAISSARGASGPSEIALGDFNGDGNLDVAVTTETGNLLNILLGNGDGTFQTPMTITTGTGPICPVVMDFNADGKLDLAFIQKGSGTIRILLGEGDGGFLSPIDVTLGGTLTRMIAADLDGNGTPDLAVLSQTLDRVLVLPGNGTGTFGSAQMYYAGTGIVDLAAADFNGDGRTDLAVASSTGYWVGKIFILLGVNPSPSSVVLNISTPSSTLSQEITLTVSVGPSGAAGWVTFYDGATPLGSAQVSAGQATFQTRLLDSGTHLLRAVFSGDGTIYGSSVSASKTLKVTASSVFAFGPPVRLSPGAADTAAQADFNGDGKVDLVVYDSSARKLTVLLGQGNGQFSAGTPFTACTSVGGLLAADFNRDGKTDLLVSGVGSEYNNCLLLGKGDGTFQSPLGSISGVGGPVLAADFNGDGVTDFVSGNSVFLSRGDGTFESPIQSSLSFSLWYAAVGDLNGDGRADLAVASPSNGYVYILLAKGDGTFLSPVPYATVGSPTKIVIGDFDGDGIPDIAVGDSASGGRVGIMIGLGPGTFENWGDALTGLNGLQYLGTCDCDGDGKVDLLASISPNVKLLRGLGNGTFQNGVDYASISSSTLAFLTDLNLDGKPDLVTYGATGSGVFVRMAVYPSSVSLSMTPAPAKLSEEVTLTAALTPAVATGTVTFYDDAILLGTATIAGGQAVLQTKWLGAGVHKLRARYSGDPLRYVDSVSANVNLTVAAGTSGGFGAGTTFGTGRGPRGVAAGDLNGDGKQDLVVANATSNTISVLLGNGDGSFATRVSYNTGSAPVAVAVADLNGDGKLDVAVANSGSNNISVLAGNGDGTLQTAVNYAAATAPSALAIADLNDDQLADVLIGSTYGPNVMWATSGGFSISQISQGTVIGVGASDLNSDARVDMILLTTGDIETWLQQPGGTFSYASYVAVSTTPAGLAMGDFNGDGKLDLATANKGSNNASVTIGNGDGTFKTAVSYAAGTGPMAIVTTDCNGDGKMDLVIVNGAGNSVTILLGKGDGTFLAGSTVATGGSPRGVVAADFDGNGITDLAVTNSADDTVSIFLGSYPLHAAAKMADFNSDGKADILWRYLSAGDLNVWYMNGAAVTGDAWLPRVSDQQWQIAGIGDFNGDGAADVLWRYAPTGDMNLWFMSGIAVTSDAWLPRVSDPHWQIAGIGDFNKDGKSDIVWRNAITGDINVWFMNGATVTGDTWLPCVTDQQWQIAGIGDFNGDGGGDIVWRYLPSGDIDVWLMDGATVTSDAWLPRVADPQWQINAIGDFNGDGNAEIVWRHTVSGDINVWFMNGTTVIGDTWLPRVTDPQWKIVGPK